MKTRTKIIVGSIALLVSGLLTFYLIKLSRAPAPVPLTAPKLAPPRAPKLAPPKAPAPASPRAPLPSPSRAPSPLPIGKPDRFLQKGQTRQLQMRRGKPAKTTQAQRKDDRLGAIDRILEKLELGNVAFNAPQSMNLSNTAVIHLLLSLATPTEELKRLIEEEGIKEGANIRVSDCMEARLSGPNFAITAITPEKQAVSRSNITEWKWEIKPNSVGVHYLHLTLSAILRVDGTSMPKAIRTFDKVIEVRVTWNQRVWSFFEKNWQWLWAVILLPIVSWFWTRMKRYKSNVS